MHCNTTGDVSPHRLRADSRHCHSTREIHEHLSADEMTDLFVVLCSSVSSTMHFTSGLIAAHTRPKFPHALADVRRHTDLCVAASNPYSALHR